MRERGHEVLITATDKEVSLELLNSYGFDYIDMGSYGQSTIKKMLNIPLMALKMYKKVNNFRPDIFVGIAAIRAAHAAKLTRKPCIVFDDTEHSKWEHILYAPFADVICTPSCFRKDLGKKQVRYNGYHELAYLHPDYFKPDPSVLKFIGLKKGDKFVVIRFVAWKAVHDINQHGFSPSGKRRLLEELEKKAPVFLTSENPLPEEFSQYSANIPSQMLHDLLYYAELCVSEGGTTATEAAVLGTPAIHVSTTAHYCGNFDDMNQSYELIETCSDENTAINRAIELLDNGKTKSEWQQKRQKMLAEKIDVTRFMLKLVESHANSGKKRGKS
jgi:predicted glycosyltransferase